MTWLSDVAVWLVSALIVLGATFALIGSLGLLRLDSFYKRVHAPTLGSTFGTAFICLGSFIFFALHRGSSGHQILILAFVTATTPAGLILLVRAARFRDRAEAPTLDQGMNADG
jgi:multicomponent K+:H+ antiporter subunit G